MADAMGYRTIARVAGFADAMGRGIRAREAGGRLIAHRVSGG
jgi:hypothetical protein